MRGLLLLALAVLGIVLVRQFLMRPRATKPQEEPGEPASLSWSVEPADERHDGVHREDGGFVPYRSLLRTTNLARLTILEAILARENIRHYRSQTNLLHGGEVQLFVERDRLEHAEAILVQMDEKPED